MICQTPDCENYVEGTTNHCATHNALARKEHRNSLKEKKKYVIPKVSPIRERQLLIYNERVKEWKKGKKCGVTGCGKDCEDNHHMKGREGVMLFNENYWFPVCRDHHEKITKDSAWAIREGYSISRNKNI